MNSQNDCFYRKCSWVKRLSSIPLFFDGNAIISFVHFVIGQLLVQ